MSAVSLPFTAELPAGVIPDASPTLPATGFIELLSTAAANIGARAPLAVTQGEAGTGVPLPNAARAGAGAAKVQELAIASEATAIAPASQSPVEVVTPQPPLPVLPLAQPEKASAGQSAAASPSAVEIVAAQATAIPVGAARAARQRSRDKEGGEARPNENAPADSQSWTIQQALAAAAAMAGPPAAAAPSSALPVTRAQALAAAPVSAMVPGKQPLSSILQREHALADDGLMSPSPVTHTVSSLAPPLDLHVLGAALAHEKPLAAAHSLVALADAARTSADPELQQLDGLMRDIASLSGASGRAAFRLTADQLGPLDVRLHSSDAGVAVTIRTHDDQSRATVAQAQHQLSDDMRANGLKVAATNVMLGGGGADRQRHDRPQEPAVLPIEAAPPEAEQSSSSNEPRPDGRYA